MAYKKDQGRMARMAGFWTLAVLIFYGTTSLNTELAVRFDALAEPIGGRIPVLAIDLTPALMISAVVLCLALWLLFRWQNKPRNADFLIETETELRKVTWPSLDDAVSGSMVVMVCVLFLMAFLAGADYMLGRLARKLLLGRG